MIIKTTMVVIFNLQNSHLFTLSLPTGKGVSGKRPKSASGKSSSCPFSFSDRMKKKVRNAKTKATEYATFGFSFSILVFFPF